ncbi:D-ribose pyranase [Gracilinema caldarium]|uniref:D-ribose pyranase n=1 Tax=Gracilinema caldarium (strain ATCC 51460 / DSM 7334 / H1) TaxID=744872 RepID=F8F0A5_GRAC1|nr:D-ribose pyranase [Gracilinema caldarium]AEJ18969.1 D-ribose pyranase [Gracilinema caldarium DSM 7334]
MKKLGILNSAIATVLAHMGHTDMITIADCGLPIPDTTQRIDLAVKKGLPSFLDVLDAVREDMVVEKITLAEEIKIYNAEMYNKIKNRFPNVVIQFISHEEFKVLTVQSKAVIRTGEASPYANIVLHSGVNF